MECRFDLADVRTVVKVDQPPYRALGQAEPRGQRAVADPFGTHRDIESDLGGRECRQSNRPPPPLYVHRAGM